MDMPFHNVRNRAADRGEEDGGWRKGECAEEEEEEWEILITV